MRPWFIDAFVFLLVVVGVVVGVPFLLAQIPPTQPTFVSRQEIIREKAKEVVPECVREVLRHPGTQPEFANSYCECYAPRSISTNMDGLIPGLQNNYNRQSQSECENRTVQSLVNRGDLTSRFDRIAPDLCKVGFDAIPAKASAEKRSNFCGCFTNAMHGIPYLMARVAFLGDNIEDNPIIRLRARECGADLRAPGRGWAVSRTGTGATRATLDVSTHPAFRDIYFECSANKKLTLGRTARSGETFEYSNKLYIDMGAEGGISIEFKKGEYVGAEVLQLYNYMIDYSIELEQYGESRDNFALQIPYSKDNSFYPTHVGNVEKTIGPALKACLPGNSIVWNRPAADEPASQTPDRWTLSSRLAFYDMQNAVAEGERAVHGLSFQCKSNGAFKIFGDAVEKISADLAKQTKPNEVQKTIFTVKTSKGDNVDIPSECGDDEGGASCWIPPKIVQMQALLSANEAAIYYAGKELIRFPFGGVSKIRGMLEGCTFIDSTSVSASENVPAKTAPQAPIPVPASPAPPRVIAPDVKVGQVVTLVGSVNVRATPLLDGAKRLELPPGTAVRVTRLANEEWSEVEVGGRVAGFVKNSALIGNSGGASGPVQTAPERPAPLPMMPAPTSGALNGQNVPVPGPKVGQVFTLTSGLNVRGLPSAEGSKLAEMPRGTRIKVTRAANDEWSEVEVGGRVVGFAKNTAIVKNTEVQAGIQNTSMDAMTADVCKKNLSKMDAEHKEKWKGEVAFMEKEAIQYGKLSDASGCVIARRVKPRLEALLAMAKKCKVPEYGIYYQVKMEEEIKGYNRIMKDSCR